MSAPALRRFGAVGVDETVKVETLIGLSKKYPQLELGVCLCYQGTPDEPNSFFEDDKDPSEWKDAETTWHSKLCTSNRLYDNKGTQRMYGYPGWAYIKELKKHGHDLRLSLHLNDDQALNKCSYVRSIVDGEQWVAEMLKWFADGMNAVDGALRVQVNLTGRSIPLEAYDADPDKRAQNVVNLAEFLTSKVQLVIPFKEKPGPFVQAILRKAKEQGYQQCFSLFHDPSAGQGKSVDDYFDSDSDSISDVFDKSQWMGYSGGLKHETCVETAAKIHEAAKGHPSWTDMQTHVRTPTILTSKPDEPVPKKPRRNRYFGDMDVEVIELVCERIFGDEGTLD